MSEVLIREAQYGDIDAIVELLADDELGRQREAPGDPAYERAFREIDDDPRNLLVVAIDDGDNVVGTLQLTFLPGLAHRGAERAQIEAVRVASSARGHGLGRELMTWAIRRARNSGCAIVQLTSSAQRTEAHRFYEALGFEVTHVGMKLTL